MYLKYEGKAPFEKSEAKYVYVLIRSDLSLAQQGVQAVHAGMAASHEFGGLTDDTRLAMLSVNNEAELEFWAKKLEMSNVIFKAFWEPDNNTGWSSLATSPISREEG